MTDGKPMKAVEFDGNLVAAVHATVPRREVRWFLCCVLFDGPYLVGSDGRVLTVAYDPDADNAPTTLHFPPRALSAMRRFRSDQRVHVSSEVHTPDNQPASAFGDSWRMAWFHKHMDPDRTPTSDPFLVQVLDAADQFPAWRSLVVERDSDAKREIRDAHVGLRVLDVIARTAKIVGAESVSWYGGLAGSPHGLPASDNNKTGVARIKYDRAFPAQAAGRGIFSLAVPYRPDNREPGLPFEIAKPPRLVKQPQEEESK